MNTELRLPNQSKDFLNAHFSAVHTSCAERAMKPQSCTAKTRARATPS